MAVPNCQPAQTLPPKPNNLRAILVSSCSLAPAARSFVPSIDHALEELRNDCAGADRLVEEAFDEIDRLRVQLLIKSRELDARERELKKSRRAESEKISQLLEQLRLLPEQLAESHAIDSRAIEQRAAEWEARCKVLENEQRSLSQELDSERAKTGERANLAAELAQMRMQLAEREREVEAWPARLEEVHCERDSLQTQLAAERLLAQQSVSEQEKTRAERDALQEQLKATRHELQKLTQHAADREDLLNAEWRVRTEGVQQECEVLQQQVQRAQGELARFQDLSRELNETRQQLAAAESSSAAGSATWGQQLANLESERAELEAELELVRGRAAELQETVDQQQNALSAQSQDTSDELKLLRLMAEQQALMIAGARAAAAQPQLQGPPANSDEQPNNNDAVVQSVMAQFAKLQKGVAERRRKQSTRET